MHVTVLLLLIEVMEFLLSKLHTVWLIWTDCNVPGFYIVPCGLSHINRNNCERPGAHPVRFCPSSVVRVDLTLPMQAEVWAAIGDLRSLALRRSNETGCRPLSLPLSFRPFCVLLHVWPVMSYVGNESYKRTSAVGAPVAADTKNPVLDTYT